MQPNFTPRRLVAPSAALVRTDQPGFQFSQGHYGILDRHQHARTNRDLTGLGLIAKARGHVYSRAERA
jgi:hypothetical protein